MHEVVKIGTRAIIAFNSTRMFATHSDGRPSGLGRALLQCDKSFDAIVQVARAHSIDAAHRSVREELGRKGVLKFEVGDIRSYGDWAEFEYDVRGTNVYFRPLEGSYPFSLSRAPEFRLLTKQEVEKDAKR